MGFEIMDEKMTTPNATTQIIVGRSTYGAFVQTVATIGANFGMMFA
jgi:hypothetical protein